MRHKRSLVPPGLDFMRHNILTKDNLFGVSAKAKWGEGLGLATVGETLFFAGCGYQFDTEGEMTLSMVRKLDRVGFPWESALGMTKALNKIGISPVELYGKLSFQSGSSGRALVCGVEVLKAIGLSLAFLYEEEPCCAGPLYFFGYQSEFAERAARARDILKDHGVKRIIGMVPSCVYTLKELFPHVLDNWDIEVKHFVEVVHEVIRAGKTFRLAEKVKVTYHDSCVMSRLLGLIEEPREILRSIEGVEFVDPEHVKGEFSTCCGGGGGFEVIYPGISHLLARNRVNELLETEASVIVTSCPGCLMQLKDGVKDLKTRGVEVLDMAELLRRALPED